MTTELSKKLVCILMRSGVEIWIEKDKLEDIEKELEIRQFVNVEGRLINRSDVSGAFFAEDMEDNTRRKNGQWQKNGQWYSRGDRVCKCGNVVPFGKTCGQCA